MYDEANIDEFWNQAVSEIEHEFTQEAERAQAELQYHEQALVRLRRDLDRAEAERAESNKTLETGEDSSLRAFASIALGALGFLGACQLTAWTLSSLLPPSIASKVDVTPVARAFQAALASLHLRQAAVCTGLLVLILLTLRQFRVGTRTVGSVKFGKREGFLAAAAAILVLIPFYSFDANSNISLFQGAFVSAALASPLFALVQIRRVRDFITADSRRKYTIAASVILVVAAIVSIASQFYLPLLGILLFASVFFFELIIIGSDMRRRLLAFEAFQENVRKLISEEAVVVEKREKFASLLQALPRIRAERLREVRAERDRRRQVLDQERRWHDLLAKRKAQ